MSGAIEPGFTPPRRLLLGPGPSEVSPRVLAAMAQPQIGHLDPAYLGLMDRIQERLRAVFRTQNPRTFAISGTGSAGMEACLVNLLEPGEKLLVLKAGYFGERIAAVAERAGAEVATLERPWGDVFPVEQVADALEKIRPKVLAVVHAETSTGALQPIEGLGEVCRRTGSLLLVDAVTSLGGVPLDVDAWGIDAAYSVSQKCLACPSGLSPITLGARALDALERRKRKVQSFYFDTALLADYWGPARTYHHTAPIAMNFALAEGLRETLEEGLESRWARHERAHRALKAGLRAMGIGFASAGGHELPTLNTVKVPEGVDETAVRKALLADYGIEVGAGLGAFRGKVWRVGLMGHGARRDNVLLFLAALERLLARAGRPVPSGAAVDAADAVFAG